MEQLILLKNSDQNLVGVMKNLEKFLKKLFKKVKREVAIKLCERI